MTIYYLSAGQYPVVINGTTYWLSAGQYALNLATVYSQQIDATATINSSSAMQPTGGGGEIAKTTLISSNYAVSKP